MADSTTTDMRIAVALLVTLIALALGFALLWPIIADWRDRR